MDQNFVAPETMAGFASPGAAARRGAQGAGASSAEAKAVGALNTTASVLNAPNFMEFMGMAGGFVLGKVVGLFSKNAELIVRTNVLAPFSALRKTTWNNLGAFPAHWHASVHEHAMRIGEKATGKLLEAAEKRAADAARRGATLAHTVKPLPTATRVTAEAGSGLASRFANWRGESRLAGHTKHLGKATEALTQQPRGIWEKLTFKKPQTITLHPELSGIARDLEHAKNITCSATRANHMHEVCHKLAAMANTPGNEALSAQASQVLGAARKAGKSAWAAHGYAEAATQGLKGLGTMLMKAGGCFSVFGTLVAAGATATVGAAWLHAHHTHAQGQEVLDQMAVALGPEGQGYLALVKQAAVKQTLANAGKMGLKTVGEAAMAATIASSQQGAVGGGMMAAGVIPMFVGEAKQNPVIEAYQALGNPDLPKDQRVMAIKQLCAIVPSVAAHGGIYNRLNSYMAKHLADKNMSREDVIRLAANDKAFNALAEEMNEKMKAAAAPSVAQPAPAEATPALNPVAAAPVTVIGGAKAANQPNAKGISQIQNLGRLADAAELKRA